MIATAKPALLALVSCAMIGATPAGTDADQAGYDLLVPVDIAAGSSVQRLAIPAQVMVASRTPDLADIRVFDATGRAMPLARIAPAKGAGRSYDMVPLPILGSALAMDVTGVSLRLDTDGRARIARIDGAAAGRPAIPIVLGALMDTRAVIGTADSLTLAAEMPGSQPVTFTVEASANLQAWRPIAERVMYRGAAANGGNAVVKVALGGARLDRDYVRVTWRASSQLLSPVTIRTATLRMRPGAATGTSIDASLPPLLDHHVAEFAVPFASAIERIRIVPTGADLVLPVRILGRADREAPWSILGKGTAARPAGGAPARTDIVLAAGPHRIVRVEADERSAGFTSAPDVRLGFAPRAIAFLAAGRPPYTLAVGRTDATDTHLPLASLMTQTGGSAPATASARPSRTILKLPHAGTGDATWRKALLWIALLAATALLAAIAWTLWKREAARE